MNNDFKEKFIINESIILFERNLFQYIIRYSKELNTISATLYSIYDVSYVCINKSLQWKVFLDKKEEKRKERYNMYNIINTYD